MAAARKKPTKPTNSRPRQRKTDSLPNVSKWLPRVDTVADLAVSYRRRCDYAERRLLLRAAEERANNIDNFDSGLGIEEIVREELSALLPKRYQITSGVMSDRSGATAGQCDVVIFNDTWFPLIKAGVGQHSNRRHLPVEGAYAVIEVKQSLDVNSLDNAMQKLVTSHRLDRPLVPLDRITENRETGSCTHAISNPLYSAILAVGLSPKADFQDLILRFVRISQLLKRREIIASLVVLGKGSVRWGFIDHDADEIRPALFKYEDLRMPIRPAYFPDEQEGGTFYRFAQHLSTHLYQSVLGAEDIAVAYGERSGRQTVKLASADWAIEPDPDLVDFLNTPCNHSHSERL